MDSTESGEPQEQPQKNMRYSCRNCRSTLFHSSDVLSHNSQAESGRKPFSKKKGPPTLATGEDTCGSLFIGQETVEWITTSSNAQDPSFVAPWDLKCPKCAAKLGTASWVGLQCSCGAWISPAFKIVAGKVDEFAAE